MQHFVNNGDGWMCRHCQPEETPPPRAPETGTRGRFFSEGEAEERGEPRLSTPARARWRDAMRQVLICTRCGIEERVGS